MMGKSCGGSAMVVIYSQPVAGMNLLVFFFKNSLCAFCPCWEHGTRTPPGIPGGFKGTGELITWAHALCRT